MSNEIERHGGSSLTITDDQDFWTERQKSALAQMGVDRASNGDLAVFFHQCQRTGLDPFARQIYMIERKGKQTIQTGIDGFRLVAARTGQLDGYEETLWCGEDGNWSDVWLKPGNPAAAKVTVMRNGARYPAVALFSEYAGRKRDGNLMQMWETKGALMLAKCAEALALRKAFPQDLSGLYTSDEMQQADNGNGPARTSSRRTSRDAPQSGSSMDALAAAAAPEPEGTLGAPVWDMGSLRALVDGCESMDDLQATWKEMTAQLDSGTVREFNRIVSARKHELETEPEPAPEPEPTLDAELVEETA